MADAVKTAREANSGPGGTKMPDRAPAASSALKVVSKDPAVAAIANAISVNKGHSAAVAQSMQVDAHATTKELQQARAALSSMALQQRQLVGTMQSQM